jgi:hypothetical protein
MAATEGGVKTVQPVAIRSAKRPIGRLRMLLAPLPVFAALCSCIFISSKQYSAPTIEDSRVSVRNVHGFGRMFVMGDVIFDFSPINDVDHDVMVFPLPLAGGKTAQEGPTFTVGIVLWSTADDLQLDVKQIRFWRDPSERLAPESFMGPFPCRVGVREAELVHVPPTTLQLKRGVCTSIWVRFDAMPPNPKESFQLKIAGLSAGGRDIDLPDVTFRFARKTAPVSVP